MDIINIKPPNMFSGYPLIISLPYISSPAPCLCLLTHQRKPGEETFYIPTPAFVEFALKQLFS
jgi:hypothetical protein